MIGLGTLINTALVVAGGIAGMFFGKFITPRLQDGLMKATALSVLFLDSPALLAACSPLPTASW